MLKLVIPLNQNFKLISVLLALQNNLGEYEGVIRLNLSSKMCQNWCKSEDKIEKSFSMCRWYPHPSTHNGDIFSTLRCIPKKSYYEASGIKRHFVGIQVQFCE